jgi:hypothetical protein
MAAVLRQPLHLENMSAVSAVFIAKHCSCKVLPSFLITSMLVICTSFKALLYVHLGLDYYNSGAPYHMYRIYYIRLQLSMIATIFQLQMHKVTMPNDL